MQRKQLKKRPDSEPSEVFDEQSVREDEYELVRGILIPGGIVLYTTYTLATGVMYLPGRGSVQNRTIFLADDPVTFCSFQLVAVGIASSLFVWFFLANRPNFDRYIHYLLVATVSSSIFGLLILISKMIVWVLSA